jgi:membrane protein
MIEAAGRDTQTGLLATIIGLATLLFGASGVFGELQDSLNTIWGVKPRPGRGVRDIVRDRFASFTMVMGIAFLLLVSLVLTAAIAALGTMLDSAGAASWLHSVNALASFGIVTLLFAAMYKYVPDVRIEWRDVWIGAAVTSLLFTAGKFAIGLYLGRSGVASAYGAAGSFAVLLVWVYYSAQILFLGAEFTKVYAATYGSGIRPQSNAVPVTPEARAEQGLRPVPSAPTAIRAITGRPVTTTAAGKPLAVTARAARDSRESRLLRPRTPRAAPGRRARGTWS